MTNTAYASPRPMSSPYFGAGFWGLMVVVATTVHHVWGAVLYDTPYRLHIVFISLPIAAGFIAALWFAARTGNRQSGRTAAWIAGIVIIVFCTLAIGIYEGGYNHLLKNFVYFTHGPVTWMFPDGVTGIPDDFIFEATGIAQVPIGIMAGLASWRLLRTVRS